MLLHTSSSVSGIPSRTLQHSIPKTQPCHGITPPPAPPRVISAIEDAAETLNKVFKKAFHGFIYGEGCEEEGCIDYEITYTQVSTDRARDQTVLGSMSACSSARHMHCFSSAAVPMAYEPSS